MKSLSLVYILIFILEFISIKYGTTTPLFVAIFLLYKQLTKWNPVYKKVYDDEE